MGIGSQAVTPTPTVVSDSAENVVGISWILRIKCDYRILDLIG